MPPRRQHGIITLLFRDLLYGKESYNGPGKIRHITVVAQGDDYRNLDALMENMAEHNRTALSNGGIVIACGMSKNNDDMITRQVLKLLQFS